MRPTIEISKRHIKETYERNLYRRSLICLLFWKGDLHKRPITETNNRDLNKKPIKKNNARDI